jgi:hypothetical protein
MISASHRSRNAKTLNSLGERGGAAAGDPLAVFAVPSGQDQFGVGLFDGLLEQAAFEQLAAPLDARFKAFGEIGVVRGQGQFQADLSLKDEALVLALDLGVGDRSLKLLRGTHGDVLRWRGGVALRALLSIPSRFLQIRAQTADRQENFWPVRTLNEPDVGGRNRRRTPAMAAGLADRIWAMHEWVTMPSVQRR